MALRHLFRLTAWILFLIALCSLTVAQVDVQSPWLVAEFRVRQGEGAQYGRMAAEAVAEVVRRQGFVASLPVPGRSGPRPSINAGESAQRLAKDHDAENVILGEISVARVAGSSSVGEVQASLGIVVFSGSYGVSLNGSLAQSDVAIGGLGTDVAIHRAIDEAAVEAARGLFTRRLPRATVTQTSERFTKIDGGSAEGFRKGQQIVFSRGRTTTCHGIVVRLGRHRADVALMGNVLGHAPGVQALGEYEPPAWSARRPQATNPPVWAAMIGLPVGESSRLRDSALANLTVELAQKGAYRLVPRWETTYASNSLDLKAGISPNVRAALVGDALGATTVFVCEVLEDRVEETHSRRKATVDLRVVAYDVMTGEPVDGVRRVLTLVGQESPESLLWKATRQAVGAAASALQKTRILSHAL